MTTLREELKMFDFIDDEDDHPIIVESYHINDVLKAVKEWLIQDLKDPKLHPVAYSYLKSKVSEIEK